MTERLQRIRKLLGDKGVNISFGRSVIRVIKDLSVSAWRTSCGASRNIWNDFSQSFTFCPSSAACRSTSNRSCFINLTPFLAKHPDYQNVAEYYNLS